MNRVDRLAVAACLVFMACGGSTTETGSSNHGGSGNGTNDAGTRGGSAGAPSNGDAMAQGGRAPGAGAVEVGGYGRAGSYGASSGDGPEGGVICTNPFCDPPPDPEPPGPSLCGGAACAPGEVCCLTTLACFDPKTKPDSCKSAPPTNPDPNGRPACSSNADCVAGEYCQPGGGVFGGAVCGGAGFCQSRTNCGTSAGSVYCGCDGRTYPNIQTACFYGVRTSNMGACGSEQLIGGGGRSGGRKLTLCGADSQCPDGQSCCALTGLCYEKADAALCAYPPEGTSRACLTNADCFTEDEFCDGAGCTGPGGCKRYGACGALLKPVCGCDRQTYVNAECASSKGVRVASDGECH